MRGRPPPLVLTAEGNRKGPPPTVTGSSLPAEAAAGSAWEQSFSTQSRKLSSGPLMS